FCGSVPLNSVWHPRWQKIGTCLIPCFNGFQHHTESQAHQLCVWVFVCVGVCKHACVRVSVTHTRLTFQHLFSTFKNGDRGVDCLCVYTCIQMCVCLCVYVL